MTFCGFWEGILLPAPAPTIARPAEISLRKFARICARSVGGGMLGEVLLCAGLEKAVWFLLF